MTKDREEITLIENMTSVQLLNQLYREVIIIKTDLTQLKESVANLKDRSKDFSNETSDLHTTCKNRYEKCNERFERVNKDNANLTVEIKGIIGKYGALYAVGIAAITAAIVKFINFIQ